jgi:hypothetical protein
MNKGLTLIALLFAFVTNISTGSAQQITGAWKGKINNQRVELKIIQNGDSLTGTSYYYGLTGNHKRYSIKGYFDPYNNSVVWWDDELITAKGASADNNSLLSVADFNCPGGNRMFLDGKSSKKEEPDNPIGKVNLIKIDNPSFHDEWDFVIDNYPTGSFIIDSISRIARMRNTAPEKTVLKPVAPLPPVAKAQPIAKAAPAPVLQKQVEPTKPATIEELFARRKKTFTTEIAIAGDSIQLQFYDNAEVDGDSITLYLNNKMIFTHVRLTANPYVVTLPVNELAATNDLVMVAENLGAIPPNTALMIAMVAGRRYEAFMESTEESSSLIRFTKTK